MFPQFSQKGDKLTLPTTGLFHCQTCVLCKVLEHNVASSMAKHFTELDIHYDVQHGFREKRSCETQLIMIVDKLVKNMQMGKGLILFSWTLVKHLTKLPMKNSF